MMEEKKCIGNIERQEVITGKMFQMFYKLMSDKKFQKSIDRLNFLVYNKYRI